MKIHRIIGIILVIVGIGCIVTSEYIKSEVEKGLIEIATGQQKVDSANRLFSLNPVTKQIGGGMTRSGQRRIDDGKIEAARYQRMAGQFMIWGIISIVLGLILIVIPGAKKKKTKN